MMSSKQYILKPVPVKQYGMGHCECQTGDGFFGDLWSGVKAVGKGLKSVGLAPSKLAGFATAPLAAINPALGGISFATSEALKQAGYGKKRKPTKVKKAKGKKKK